MNKIAIFIPLLFLTGCASNSIDKQCPAEQNYLISNPELMEQYKQEFKNGEIKSLYYDSSQLLIEKGNICNNSSCVSYDNKKFNYIEKKFNNEAMSGIYTIYSLNKGHKKCNFWTQSWDNRCYYAKKNHDDDIKSKYGVIMYTEGKATILEFRDLEDNKLLYKYSNTIYLTGALGGAGFGSCGIKSNNNPKYEFHVTDFIGNPLGIPYKMNIKK